MKKKKKPQKMKINKIMSQYLQPSGSMTFKYITVYQDYSLSVGCEQSLSNQGPIRLFVKEGAR